MINSQGHNGFQPELCFTMLTGYMDMHTILFIGEEIKAIAFFSE
jgi:hypothetical protein